MCILFLWYMGYMQCMWNLEFWLDEKSVYVPDVVGKCMVC